MQQYDFTYQYSYFQSDLPSMRNKNKIIKFRKENQANQHSSKYLNFNLNQPKKQDNNKEKLNRNHIRPAGKNIMSFYNNNVVVEEQKKNRQVDKSKDMKISIQAQPEDSQQKSNRKYETDLALSDNEDLAFSSNKKKIKSIRLSMPKNFNPEKVTDDIRRSLLRDLRKSQSSLTLDEIFSCETTSNAMGLISLSKKSLYFNKNIQPEKVKEQSFLTQKRHNRHQIDQKESDKISPTKINYDLNFQSETMERQNYKNIYRNQSNNYMDFQQNYIPTELENGYEDHQMRSSLGFPIDNSNQMRGNNDMFSQYFVPLEIQLPFNPNFSSQIELQRNEYFYDFSSDQQDYITQRNTGWI